jgi:ABC-type nitrate/sulfonate/bicarbonate transport system substrate-binding protein
MKRLFIVTLILALLLGATMSSPLTAQEEDTIWIGAGSTTLDPYYVPLFTLGRAILAEQGININFVALTTDEAVEAALDRGRIDAGIISLVGVHRALSQGLSFQVSLGLLQHNAFVLVTHADVENLSELAGAQVAAQSRTSLSVTVAEVLMEEDGGLTSGEDYEMVFLAGSGNRAAALEAGSIDAAVIFGPVATDLVAANPDFKVYGGVWNVLDPMLWEGVAFSDEFRESNPELAQAFVSAMLQAYADFYEGDPAAMVGLVGELDIPEEVNASDSALEKEYVLYQEIGLYDVEGGISEEAFTRISEFLVAVGQLEEDQVVDYATAIDPTFVEAAMQ